jgi:hypothetical protein
MGALGYGGSSYNEMGRGSPNRFEPRHQARGLGMPERNDHYAEARGLGMPNEERRGHYIP